MTVIENAMKRGRLSDRWRFFCDACGIVGCETDQATAIAQSARHNQTEHPQQVGHVCADAGCACNFGEAGA